MNWVLHRYTNNLWVSSIRKIKYCYCDYVSHVSYVVKSRIVTKGLWLWWLVDMYWLVLLHFEIIFTFILLDWSYDFTYIHVILCTDTVLALSYWILDIFRRLLHSCNYDIWIQGWAFLSRLPSILLYLTVHLFKFK